MEKRNYNIEILLVLLHLTGPLADIGIILSSFYIFYLIGFRKTIDVFQIFLLLMPCIVLRSRDVLFVNSFGRFGEVGWFQVFVPTLKNATIIGPVAVSTKFFAALAVPVRLGLNFKYIRNKLLLYLWFGALILSTLGLFLAVRMGINSSGGITVGLRIALAIGALMVPLSTTPAELGEQLFKIIKVSLVLFFLGLMNEHWIFVTISFPAIILGSNLNIKWKLFAFLCILIFLMAGSTFTIKLTVLTSTFLVLAIKYSHIFRRLFEFRLVTLSLFFMPLIGVFVVVDSGLSFDEMGESLQSRFMYKLYEDRGGIWRYTLDLISTSDKFIVPAARNIAVKDYGIQGNYDWGAGAHNIFLETVRQLGLTCAVILFVLIAYSFYRAFYDVKKNGYLRNVIFPFFSVFLIYGFTGNSLVYDGVGFLFWLILGQVICARKYLQNEGIAFVGSQ